MNLIKVVKTTKINNIKHRKYKRGKNNKKDNGNNKKYLRKIDGNDAIYENEGKVEFSKNIIDIYTY